jgi:hypothetical protein
MINNPLDKLAHGIPKAHEIPKAHGLNRGLLESINRELV